MLLKEIFVGNVRSTAKPGCIDRMFNIEFPTGNDTMVIYDKDSMGGIISELLGLYNSSFMMFGDSLHLPYKINSELFFKYLKNCIVGDLIIITYKFQPAVFDRGNDISHNVETTSCFTYKITDDPFVIECVGSLVSSHVEEYHKDKKIGTTNFIMKYGNVLECDDNIGYTDPTIEVATIKNGKRLGEIFVMPNAIGGVEGASRNPLSMDNIYLTVNGKDNMISSDILENISNTTRGLILDVVDFPNIFNHTYSIRHTYPYRDNIGSCDYGIYTPTCSDVYFDTINDLDTLANDFNRYSCEDGDFMMNIMVTRSMRSLNYPDRDRVYILGKAVDENDKVFCYCEKLQDLTKKDISRKALNIYRLYRGGTFDKYDRSINIPADGNPEAK